MSSTRFEIKINSMNSKELPSTINFSWQECERDLPITSPWQSMGVSSVKL